MTLCRSPNAGSGLPGWGDGMDAKRWTLAGLLLATAVSMGCNPIMSMWFLTQGWKEPLTPAPFPLADKSGKEVRVLFLAATGADISGEFVGVERQLAEAVGKALTERCQTNHEKIVAIPQHKVDQYKRGHPDWSVQAPVEIGKELGATVVVDMAVSDVQLYKQRTNQTIYNGQADVTIDVWDTRKPDGEAKVWNHEYNCEYPRGGTTKTVEDIKPRKFKDSFMKRMGRDIAGFFTTFPSDDERLGEPELGLLMN